MTGKLLGLCAALWLLMTSGAAAGDPANGRTVFLDRERGHCLLCHRVASLDEPFQGDIGPDLSAVGERLSPAQMRLRIVDPTRLNPDTAMPAYHRTHDLHQVAEAYLGKPVLTAQEVEDVVAYLATLRQRETVE
ncbi:MAG: sulfur oxidation c-type cytochrome SoxX [Alphaproteobacteria bacterium]|nr:sulfur oxidation c-type cytochrome SoxX [Alphaproteobacteria bacterium]